MQNDIVKPPAVQPEQPVPSTKPDPKPGGSEVRVAPVAQPNSNSKPPKGTIPQSEIQLSETQKPRRKKPMRVIISAVVVFLGLTGGIIYAALQNPKDTKPVASTSQAPAAQTNPIDAAPAIDDALSEAAQLPTSNEDPAADLSDQALGL